MENTILWKPSNQRIRESEMSRFIQIICNRYGLNRYDYQNFHKWSTTNIADFWKEIWEYCGIKYSSGYSRVIDDPGKMPGAGWFEGARLNFAENLLQKRDETPAIIFRGETFVEKTLTYNGLFEEVQKVSGNLRNLGLRTGDRVAAILPNMPETVIAMLAATSIGAIWSSTSPDFGIKGIVDRFTQIKPKVIIASDGYYYKGKSFNTQEKLQGIICELPSVEKVILVDYIGEREIVAGSNTMSWEELSAPVSAPLHFEQLPFDHPLYILYSSGTTGLPKSIVHSAGGSLIQHLKEQKLHCDIHENDRIFYFTTCGWMMWNWFVSGLALGATLVLFDGNPFYPEPEALLNMADELDISFFGTSAKYIASLQEAGVTPSKISDYPCLKVIASTGSPLPDESFEYVYHNWKKDVQLSSISGGTDIISCFFLGNPILPVYKGEIQCIGLGMDVDCYNEFGKSVRGKQGELICKSAFPSMPVFFWNDPENKKFKKAYFDVYPGIWRHGDYIEITNHGGIKMFGRSDATLNPQGVRIGTAEIYRVVEKLEEIEDSVVVGRKVGGDEEVVLLVKMKEGNSLNLEADKKIKSAIRSGCSPRHVPAVIKEVPDIPYTINGKKV
ncbi:MAG: acetoacetate--CoA ligase, partial [Bacteroidales bacterium]|nr:acetoacetate--CoA ligase [Bacteroidales bacterium]